MRKTFLFILALCATIMAWGTPKSGLIDGTYYIASKTDLEGFRDAVNGGQYSLNAVQTADIDFGMTTGAWEGSWQVPIGTTDAKAYTGTYDGQGYTISNFLIFYHTSVDTQLKTYVGLGLFGVVKGATLKNIHITCATENKFEGNPKKMTVKGCGILCGQMQDATLIEDCSVEGGAYVSTASNAAILCGNDAGSNTVDAKSTINRCWVSGTLRIGRTGNFGGILGYAYNVSIMNCYNLGTLNVVRDFEKINVGGILGYGNASSGPREIHLSNCYNYGTVTDGRAAGATTQTLTLGAIAGNDKGSSYASVFNLYFLTGSCASAGSGIVSSAVSKSTSEFKTLAASLGDEFVDGTDYPVFAKLTPALEFAKSAFEVNTEETSIENSLVGLVADAYPNFGTLTYEMTDDAIGTLVSGTPNVELNGTAGTATVTAKVAGSDYYAANEISYTITVVDLPSPELSFADGDVSKDMNASGYVNTLTNKGDGEVSYSSSNEMVATVATDGTITIIGTGTTTITASSEKTSHYLAGEANYTLTVTEPTGEEAITETFSQIIVKSSWVNKDTLVYGDNDIYQWKLYHFRKSATELRTGWNATNNYIAFDGEMEGGIKRVTLSFKPQEVNTFPANINIDNNIDGEGRVLRQFHLDVDADNVKKMEYSTNLFIKKNSGFRLQVPITETKTSSDIWYYSVKITPYLLYTKKVVEVTYDLEGENTVDATANLINNTGEPPTITLSDGVQAQLDEDGKTINLENVTEDITVTASWNEGKVTTTFTLKVKKELVYPEVIFELGPEVEKTMNDVPFVNAITSPTEGLGEIAYSSTDPTVAEVATDGTVTIIGAGETEIKLAIDASDTYDATEVKYTLTVTEPEGEEAYIETFKEYETAGWPSSLADETDRTGDDATITWKAKLSRHKTDDKLKNGDRSTWFAQNGYIKTNFEGGIKRIAFQWNKFTPGTADITLAVSAGDKVVNATYSFEATTDPINQVDPDINFNRNFFVQKNVELQIKNVSATDKRAQVGPIKITPYLFYKTKYVEVMKSAGPYVNTDIINNTNGEGTITFESSDPGTAYIFTGDELHPDKVVFVKTGTVTITATWEPYEGAKDAGEYVTTSYTLKINDREYSDAHFEVSKVEKKLGDKFTYAVTRTKGEGDVEYSSDDPTIAEVNVSTGEVTVHRIGTTKINAHVDESAQYYAWDGSYTLIVRTGIADDNKLVEKFTKFPTSIIDTKGGKDVNGDIGVTWHAYQTRRGENDTIGGTGVQGNNINAEGYIKSNTALEGGIKYFSFNWKQWATESNCTLKLRAKLGESDFSMEKAGTGVPTYEHYFFAINAGVKTNANIELYNESYNGSGSLGSNAGRITFDAFEIVPYLYYKTKSHVIDNASAGATYTHPIINNIDNEEGTITYSLIGEGDDAIAGINAKTGQVTVNTGGVVTVQAKWVPEGAGEDEFVTTTYELTINFPTPEVTFTAPESVALDGTIGEGDMNVVVKVGGEPVDNPTITYTSSNNNVIKITDAGWNVIGIGTTTITANVDGTTTYGPASETADIEVTNIIPADGTYWKETFSSLGTNSGYDITLTTIEGDDNVLKWKTRNFERNASTDKIYGEQGIRLNNKGKGSYENPGYVEYFTEGDVTSQEGGIKRVQFKWRIPVSEDNKKVVFDVKYKEGNQTVVRTMTYNNVASNTEYDYAQNFNLKNNNKLTIAGSKTSESPVIIGPITITPYLLYTTKTDTLNLTESSTYKNEDLINNLEQGDEVTYSIIQGNEGEIASIETDGTVTATAAGEITIQAKWTDGDNTITTTYKLKIKKCITISESVGNSDILAANDGQTVDVKIVRSALVANTWNSLCLPFDIEKSELGDAKVAILDHATLEGDVLNIWLAPVTGTLTAGTPYLVLPNTAINLSGDYEGKQIVANVEDQEVNMVTLKGIFSPFEMTANDETKLFLGQPDEGGHNLFYPSQDGSLKGMRAYFQLTTPNNIPVRVGRIGIQQTPTELGGEADRLNGRQAMKVLRDGQFYIIRETKTYNAQGIEIQ